MLEAVQKHCHQTPCSQCIGIRINILHLVVTNDITQNRLDGVPDKTVYKLNINIKVLLSK